MVGLQVTQLTKWRQTAPILSDISFTIQPGEVVAFYGPPGSGKRTLLSLLAGLMEPTSGRATLNDREISHFHKQGSGEIGLWLKEMGVYERVRVKDYLALFQALYRVPTDRVQAAIEASGLIDRQDQRIGRLAPDLVARVHMARLLVQQPLLYLLEEPTVGLEFETTEILRTVIQKQIEQGAMVLFATTSREEAEALAHRIARLYKGRIESWHEKEADDDAAPAGAIGGEAVLRRLEKIPAKIGDRLLLFDPLELTYVESQDGLSVLHTPTESYPCPLTLAELERRLRPYGFFRSHRSYIVNLQRVREVVAWSRSSYSLILDDPQKSAIPLSKNNYRELEEALGF